ncbi:hypothetical protein WH50_00530 [Pokkaliibacter plantistimulans]|uniref:Uncharacterized protein n=2 Tax=Pokkaliibacter plantistimulans TaxID=1635171 RepID=A0ABX5M2B0_9GAMM|nr:hypothetical protein WH50_00530 [Pokkaliibacter plantistimulans]
MISAPGAVGKSALAEELCSRSNSIYLNLADADTIAGNYIIGGLVKNGLYDKWAGGNLSLVIDALDEARLRVTQSSFEDFLSDLFYVSQSGNRPIVLLGRVGIIDETWLIIKERFGISLPIFDIEFFNQDEAVDFLNKSLEKLSKNSSIYPHLSNSLTSHATVYESTAVRVVEELSSISSQDSSKFFGYAPVLDAVSKLIASVTNANRIVDEVTRVIGGKMLFSICEGILDREKVKFTAQLPDGFSDIEMLYTSKEQLDRLARRLFSLPMTIVIPSLTQEQRSRYEEAVETMIPQHPFLDGIGRKCSSSVFEACIVSYAILDGDEDLYAEAIKYFKNDEHTPNPFVFEFFKEKSKVEDDFRKLKSLEVVGFLFDSLIAGIKSNERSQLSISESEDSFEVEFSIKRSDCDQSSEIVYMAPFSGGELYIGRKVSNIYVNAEKVSVCFLNRDQIEFVAPAFFQCEILSFESDKIIVKPGEGVDKRVFLFSEIAEYPASISAPVVKGGVDFGVSFAGSNKFPWSSYSVDLKEDEDDSPLNDGLRIFRRIVMAFRSHSKGRLARFRDKVDHERMLKNVNGKNILDKMIDDSIITIESHMYYLEPNILGEKAGASFLDVNRKNYSEKTKDYIRDAIA